MGVLRDAVRCTVTEERNGAFELEMVYPITGQHYSSLALRGMILAKPNPYGEAQYFTKADLHPDDYRVLMASCCIPVIDQPCVIDGVPYFDGGLADPVPLEWAFAHGCDRVALILTKPIGLVSSDARDKHLAHLLQSHYPAAAEGLRRRAWRYNTAVQRARELERQGLVCIIAPDSTEGMSTLTKNRACLEKMYAKGKQDAEALVRWMQNTKQDESVGT